MKIKSFVLIIFLSLFIVLAIQAVAAADVYNAGDIAVIHRIIDDNGLDWEKWIDGDVLPESWAYGSDYGVYYKGIVWSEDSANKRILCLAMDNLGLEGALDVSDLSELVELRCSSNNLNALDVSGLTGLQNLRCYGNQLSLLDVSACGRLTSLSCAGNILETLDVSVCSDLETLSCYNNSLRTLDISKCANLIALACGGNKLTELDVSGCVNLEELSCDFNQLETLDISKNTFLTRLACFRNKLNALDVSANMRLIELDCEFNRLSELDVSNNTGLEYLLCAQNNLRFLNVSGCLNLTELTCDGNPLTNLLLPGGYGFSAAVVPEGSGDMWLVRYYHDEKYIELSAAKTGGEDFVNWIISAAPFDLEQDGGDISFTLPPAMVAITANFSDLGLSAQDDALPGDMQQDSANLNTDEVLFNLENNEKSALQRLSAIQKGLTGEETQLAIEQIIGLPLDDTASERFLSALSEEFTICGYRTLTIFMVDSGTNAVFYGVIPIVDTSILANGNFVYQQFYTGKHERQEIARAALETGKVIREAAYQSLGNPHKGCIRYGNMKNEYFFNLPVKDGKPDDRTLLDIFTGEWDGSVELILEFEEGCMFVQRLETFGIVGKDTVGLESSINFVWLPAPMLTSMGIDGFDGPDGEYPGE